MSDERKSRNGTTARNNTEPDSPYRLTSQKPAPGSGVEEDVPKDTRDVPFPVTSRRGAPGDIRSASCPRTPGMPHWHGSGSPNQPGGQPRRSSSEFHAAGAPSPRRASSSNMPTASYRKSR